MAVRKAVIPAAGLGTRFLPASKVVPKEMLPIVDKPVLQYIVEGAVASGIEEVVLVTASAKRAIEDHFDRSFELEYRLEAAGKHDLLDETRRVAEMAKFIMVRQGSPLGNGHAVLLAKEVVGDEPFAMLWGDDMVLGVDTLVSFEGEIFGKPDTMEEALAMLQRLNGRAHEVYSGIWLRHAAKRQTACQAGVPRDGTSPPRG